MPYHLHTVPSFEVLCREEGLRKLLSPTSLWDDPVVIVPQHRLLGKWLRLRMTDTQGHFAGAEIRHGEEVFRDFLALFSSGKSLLEDRHFPFEDELHFRLILELQALLQMHENKNIFEVYRRVFHYLLDPGLGGRDREDPEILSLRIFQLSRRIAALFYHYQLHYPRLCRRLDVGGNAGGEDHPDFAWQGHLWQKLFGADGKLCHAGMLVDAVQKNPGSFSGKKNRLIFLGSSHLAPVQLAFFRDTLSEHLEIHHVVLSGQLEEIGAAHPTIDSCTGKRREVEVLQNRVAALFREQPELKANEVAVLAPDIGLYDAFLDGVFSAGLQGQDPSGRSESLSIPYSIADIAVAGESIFWEGFFALLNLPRSRFSREECLALLQNPCLMRSRDITEEEAALFESFLEKGNFLFGMDAAHRDNLGFASVSHGTFAQVRDRLFSGMALFGNGDFFSERGILPLNQESIQEGKSRGKLALLFQDFVRDFSSIKLGRSGDYLSKTLGGWVDWAEGVAGKWLSPRVGEAGQEDRDDREALDRVFRELRALEQGHFFSGSPEEPGIRYPLFMELLKAQGQARRFSRQQPLVSGLTMGSFQSLRGVPFKAIFCLGMDEGVFPRRTERPSFDLATVAAREGDPVREAWEEDALVFREIRASCGGSLHLFFQGKDQVSSDPLEPSVFVAQLRDEAGVAVLEHPLHGHSENYFAHSKGNPLLGKNFQHQDFEAALLLRSEKKKHQSGSGDRDRPSPLRLSIPSPTIGQESNLERSLKDLERFVSEPLRVFYGETLHLRLEWEGRLEEPLDFPAREIKSFLRETLLKGGPSFEIWKKRVERAGLLSADHLGARVLAEIQERLGVLKEHLAWAGMPQSKRIPFSGLELEPAPGQKRFLSGTIENYFVRKAGGSPAHLFLVADEQDGLTKLPSLSASRFAALMAPYVHSLAHAALHGRGVYEWGLIPKVKIGVIFSFQLQEDFAKKSLGSLFSLYEANLRTAWPVTPALFSKTFFGIKKERGLEDPLQVSEVPDAVIVEKLRTHWEKNEENEFGGWEIMDRYGEDAYGGRTPDFSAADGLTAFRNLVSIYRPLLTADAALFSGAKK